MYWIFLEQMLKCNEKIWLKEKLHNLLRAFVLFALVPQGWIEFSQIVYICEREKRKAYNCVIQILHFHEYLMSGAKDTTLFASNEASEIDIRNSITFRDAR